MDKKIAKYKFKKNKLEEKIINLLEMKKNLYEEQIAKSNQKVNIELVNLIDEFFTSYDLEQEISLTIIVNGFYSVGKTTFVVNIENYINEILKAKDIEIGKVKNFITKVNKIDKNEVKNNQSNILIFETNHMEQDIKICTQIKNAVCINIIPQDIASLKKKYINKIIIDLKNGTNYFIDNICMMVDKMKNNNDDNNIIEDNCICDLKNNIELLRNNNKLFNNDDFYFLDMITEKIYNFINDYWKNESNYLYNNSIQVINYLI